MRPEEFARWRARAPELPGEIGPVQEDLEAFSMSTVIDEKPGSIHMVSFGVPKKSWDKWWREISGGINVRSVRAAEGGGPLPMPRPGNSKQLDPRQFAEDSRACLDTVPSCSDDTWDNGSLDAPLSRGRRYTAVWTGSLMVVWGGSGGYERNMGGRYDPATDTWMGISSLGAPSRTINHSAVWTGSLMVVWGGFNYYDGFLNTGGRYDPATDTWTDTSTVGAPSPRHGHAAVWTGTRMVVWGGFNFDEGFPNTGGRYDSTTDTWTPTSNLDAPSGRWGFATVWTGSLMVVWGGYDEYSYTLNTGGRYDPTTDTWTPTSTVGAPEPRWVPTVVWTGSLMVVWGGSLIVDDPDDYSGSTNTGGRYDPVADTWTPTSTVDAPSRRFGHSAVWTGSLMVVWGGQEEWSQLYDLGYQNTGGRYDPVTDTWTPTSTVGAPFPRSAHAAVWTGSLMVMWGGLVVSIPSADAGARYDPAADTWTLIISLFPRFDHTAVWTGSLMVVWGGGEYLNTGGRYDPVTDTWTTTSTLGAPSGRLYHAAVWTGSLMVVWGGVYYGQPLNTGGRYDPVTDTWTATSTVGAPSERGDPTAVWTGSLMVVWGPGNTGGRYDPATDTWTPTSTVRAPSLGSHTAVWTGRVMVVWGGRYGGPSTNTGGRYDPVTDTWTPTSTVGAPSPRSRHTAVWTGSLMVVWGGATEVDPYFLNTGGRYDPVTDIWTPTSTVGAPSGRSHHTAAWTGSLMVIWAGESPVSNTGGRYDPATDTWTATSTVGAPSERSHHTAVWTGRMMLVFGGGGVPRGGRYIVGSDDDDGDGYTCVVDCNDADPSVHPGAAEVCNGSDDDCNGIVDDGGSSLCDDRNPCTDDSCDAVGGCLNDATDPDDDAVCSPPDNCPTVYNPGQGDSDNDGQGDACDPCPSDPLNDFDRDGLCADVDACDNSNLGETVIVEKCDSGVPNTLFPSGCTIADLVNGCAAGSRNHGQFVSCVAGLLDELRSQGAITGRQKSRIQRCAAHVDPHPASIGIRSVREAPNTVRQ